MNAGSCAALGKTARFRAAAAARATFHSGKVAKAIHAAARAVLRTVTRCAHPALRESHGPQLLPRALNAVRRLAQRELAHPWARTGAPLPHARLRCPARSSATNINGNVQSCSVRALDLPPPSAAAGLRGKSPQGERDGRAHAPQAMDGHRRAPRRPAHPRSGRCRRGRLSLVPFFADSKKGTCAAAAARNGSTLRAARARTTVQVQRSTSRRDAAGRLRRKIPLRTGSARSG